MDEVIEEHGPVSGHLPRMRLPPAHPFEGITAQQMVEVQPMSGGVLTEEMVRESFEAMRKADQLITIDVFRADGRRYRIWPRGFLRWRVLWNWLRGYRKPRGA